MSHDVDLLLRRYAVKFPNNSEGVFNSHKDRLLLQGMSVEQALENMFLESEKWGISDELVSKTDLTSLKGKTYKVRVLASGQIRAGTVTIDHRTLSFYGEDRNAFLVIPLDKITAIQARIPSEGTAFGLLLGIPFALPTSSGPNVLAVAYKKGAESEVAVFSPNVLASEILDALKNQMELLRIKISISSGPSHKSD